jgi:DNA-directed RNA polymerase subunit RPC12/RpoP
MGIKNCTRCSHEWLPRLIDREPARCPRCNSPYWNRPRRIVECLPPIERIDRKSLFNSIMAEKGITVEQAAIMLGKSVTTIYNYTKATGFNVPLEAIEKMSSIDISPNSSRQFKCAIRGCSHEWTARTDVPPVACPKCHNKHWLSGLSPIEAKGALKRMVNTVPGSLADFARAVDVPAEKLLPYMQGKAMSRAQLDQLCSRLRSKGFTLFRYLD